MPILQTCSTCDPQIKAPEYADAMLVCKCGRQMTPVTVKKSPHDWEDCIETMPPYRQCRRCKVRTYLSREKGTVYTLPSGQFLSTGEPQCTSER
jgi:hypothetical protein